MQKFDTHPDVLQWNSEELAIPYEDISRPAGKRKRKYLPDFWVKKKNKNGGIDTLLVEVKPSKETAPPKRAGKTQQRYLTEATTFARNICKWQAAQKVCAKYGWKFELWTEETLGLV